MRVGSNLKILIAFVVGLAFIVVANVNRTPTKSEPPLAFLIPPSNIKLFTLGYDEMMADLLWIRVVQDFDYCEKVHSTDPSIPRAGPETDTGVARSRCDTGWVYHMLDSITELAPKFKTAYEYGALSLSIIIDDREGAKRLLDKGTERFPTDWRLHFISGYHYLYEIKDVETAAARMSVAAKSGGPPWVAALAGQLYTKAGRKEIARSVLESALEQVRDPDAIARIRKRISDLDSEEP